MIEIGTAARATSPGDRMPTADSEARLPRCAGDEPIPGYGLLELIGAGRRGEVWKCRAPGGLLKAIKFAHDHLEHPTNAAARQELAAYRRIKDIRHPFLLSLERLEVRDGRLLLVLELAERNLELRLREYRAAGRGGLPRAALLQYLRETAEALDLLNLEYGLLHLDVRPRNLCLVGEHIKLGDFSLVRAPGDPPDCLAGPFSRFQAPEALAGVPSLRSDQYSLAVVYCELLTGGSGSALDLDNLPPEDQAVVRRALAQDPRERYPSCREFVRALLGSRPGEPVGAERAPEPERNTYRFVEALGRTAFGEIWKVIAPDGRVRLARFLGGVHGDDAVTLPALRSRLETLLHPALLPTEVIEEDAGRILIVHNQPEQTLADCYQRCRDRGQPGIPRPELVRHLRGAAEALDSLAERHGLHHLGLNPRTLVLDRGRLRIAEFGLASLLAVPRGQRAGDLNPRYSAPEVFTEADSPTADQYSLAVLFQELLTGFHPLRIPARQRQAVARGLVKPDLTMLSSADQQVIGRALHHDPGKRFPSCAALLAALDEASAPRPPSSALLKMRDTWNELAEKPTDPNPPASGASGPARTLTAITNLVRTVAGRVHVKEFQGIRYRLVPGELLAHECCATLLPGTIEIKLAGFHQECRAHVVERNDEGFVFFVASARSTWFRMFGKQPGLQIALRYRRPGPSGGLTDLTIEVRPVGCGWDQGDQLLREMGPTLLASLRTYLQALPERRADERFPWAAPVRVYPAGEADPSVQPLEVQTRDISMRAIGLVAPRRIPVREITLQIPHPSGGQPLIVDATVVRQDPWREGGYEIGAIFNRGN